MLRIFLLLLLLSTLVAAYAGMPTVPINCTEDPCESEPVPPIGTPVVAQGKFVDCSAAINGSGTLVSPFNRLANVTGMATSQDLWLKAGTTCNATLSVTWSGTAADYVKIGSYYASGGIAYELHPADPTIWPSDFAYVTARAILRGTYAATCSVSRGAASNTCPIGLGAVINGAAIPTNQNTAMIELRGNYQRVQGLEVKDSAGLCISTPVSGSHHHDVMESFCNFSAASGVAFIKGQDHIAHGNYVLGSSVAGNKGDNLASDHGGGILVITDNSTPITGGEYQAHRALVTHNEIAQTYGEGLELILVSTVAARGNLIYSSGSPHVLIDRAQWVLLEQNEILGNTGGPFVPQRGVAVTAEDQPDPSRWVSSHDIVVRDNLMANVSAGLYVGLEPGIAASGKTHSVKFVGNTVLAPTSRYIDMSFMLSANIGAGFIIANNVFDLTAGTGTCVMPTSANFSMHHNGWNVLQADTDCRGTSDVTGASGVTGSVSWTTAGVNNIPLPDQFQLGSGSPLAGVAPSISTSIATLINAQHASYPSVTMPCPGIDSTLLSKSYECSSRPAQDTGAMDGGAAVGLIAATGKFVDCSLTAAGNGSLATPWNNIASITGMTTGEDLWFKEGTTCDNQALTITWSGTVSDPAVVGAYKVISGAAYQGLTDDGNLTPYGTESAGSRPILQGNYKPACRPSSCLYNVAGAIPSNSNGGGIVIGNQSYVTVQDLRIRYYAGQGIVHDPSTSGFSSPWDGHLIYQRLYVDHNTGTALYFLDSRNNIMRDSLVRHSNLDYLDNLTSDAGAGIGCGRALNANCLIEGMYVHDTFGESIDLLRGDHIILRGSYIANNRRVAAYEVGGNDLIVEQTIVVNGTPDNEGICAAARCSLPGWSGALFEGTLEEPTQHSFVPNAGRRMLFRNNIGINSSSQIGTCLNFGFSPSNEPTWSLSGKAVGNTCYVLPGNRWFGAISGGTIGSINATEKLEAANNLFFGGNATNNCTMPNYPTVIQLHHNGHTLAYSAGSFCGTTGDVVSTNIAMPGFSFSTASKTNFPRWTDVRPASTTAFKDNGVAMTSTYLTLSEWPQVAWFTWENPDCGPGGQLAPADWAKLLYADGCNKPRGAIPDPGAIEQ